MSPCQKRLDAECFRAHPAWAKQALAYRLVNLFTPKQLTRRLPKILRAALIAEGVAVPPGLVLPDGTVVAPGTVLPAVYYGGDPVPDGIFISPGTVFPPGWTPGDPLPEGVTLDPGAQFPEGWTPPDPAPDGLYPTPSIPPEAMASGPAPPAYAAPWEPGPVSTAPPAAAVAAEPWFYDDFDILDPAVWTDYSSGSGTNSIDAGKLKMLSASGGDYAFLEAAADATIPSAFTWTFELTVDSGTGQMVFVLYDGTHAFYVIFDPPTTLKFRRAGAPGYITIPVATFAGTTDTWKFDFNGTLCDIYRDSTLIASDLTVYEYALKKGARSLSCEDVLTVHIDDYTITPK